MVFNSLSVCLVPLATQVIHRLFSSCSDLAGVHDELGLCLPTGENAEDLAVILALIFAATLRLIQTVITFGTGIPAGLFVPSLFIGACVGRIFGICVKTLNLHYWHFCPTPIEPGVYAMIGAAAVLGGVCRVTISLVVIMFELTGALEYIVPFMIAVQIAKWTGDTMTEGIYDAYIVMRGYPFLHEPSESTSYGKA